MKNSHSQSRGLNPRFVAYTALAGATFAVPAVAEANIVFSGTVNLTVPSNTAGLYLNVATGATGITSASVVGWDVNPFSASNFSLFTGTGAGENGTALGAGLGAYVGNAATTNYLNLTTGTLVSAASAFGNVGTNTPAAGTPLNFSSSNNYMGFRFRNEATGQINYGWMQVSLAATAGGQPRAIVAYAYEDSGGGINVGAIPEPSTFALLGTMAAGAVGLRAWRRRKAA